MRLVVVTAVACLSLVGLAAAADVHAAIRKPINIPAQELGSALQVLAKERGFQVVFVSKEVDRVRTEGASGELTSEEALARLLEGTGLTYRSLGDEGVSIVPLPIGGGSQKDAAQGVRDSASTALSEGDRPASTAPGAPRGFWQRLRVAQGDQEQKAAEDSVAGDDSSKPEKLEEIVVTAQRRQERLIDTPISIGVLSGEELDHSSARGVADVLNQVGGVSLIETQPGEHRIAVRGVLTSAGAGTSTTGYYLDETPFMSPRGPGLPDANAFDLARVEVLRGPQGTLYGAAALGGVIRVLTNDANLSDFQIKGRTRASSTEGGGGNYGGDFAVNVPLIPGKLAIRGVAGYSELSGFIDSTGSGGQQRINDTEAQSYRLKVSYAPMDRLSIKLGLAASRIDNGATSQSLDNFTTPSSASPNKRDYDAYNLIAEYEWSGASLLSSTSYLEATVDGRGDFVLFGAPRIVVAGSSLQSFSQEFRLASHLEGPWQWSAGGIYTDGKDKISQAVLNFVFLPIFAGSPAVNTEQSESYAAFGEVTQSFDDGRFALTAGLRYFNDDYTTSQDSLFNGTTPAPGTTRNFSKTTGRLVFAYKPQEASAFYGSVATGFRSGQNQTSSVVSVSPDYPPTDPDSLITYELGAKGHLLDGALTYETAVYYMDWKDIQQSLVTPENFSARVNAGTASGAGVEATLAYRPTQALLLQASVGWNDLKLDEEIHSFPRSGGVPVDVILFRPGDRLNDSPEWTGSVGGSYRMATPMANVDFLLSTNFAYGSDRLLRALSGTSLDETYSDDFRSLKVSAGLQADRWSLDLYGDNLLDDGGSVSPPTRGAQFTSIRQRPRTIGLQVTFDF